MTPYRVGYPRLLPSTQHPAPVSGSHLHVLMQPGWHDSGPGHWQSIWQHRLGERASRVPQQDWHTPQLPQWLATAEQAIARQPGRVVLVAHSLGCVLAAYLAGGPHAHRIAGAFLVAPADVDRATCPPELVNFAPIPANQMPFPAIVVASDDDPYCPLNRARTLADAWGAELVPLHSAGHITAGSGYGEWPEGLLMLEALIARARNSL